MVGLNESRRRKSVCCRVREHCGGRRGTRFGYRGAPRVRFRIDLHPSEPLGRIILDSRGEWDEST